MRTVYTIGDCVLDLFFENDKPVEAKPGGSFLNSSVSLGRLGVNVSLISELGFDRVGEQIFDFLKQNNVDTNHIARFTDTNSNLALAFLDEKKNADYSFYKTRKGLETCIKFPTCVEKNDIVLFGSFLAIKLEFRSALVDFLKECKSKGAIIIYDPNFRAQHLPLLEEVLPFIKENIQLCDIVKASNEDFELICKATSAKSAYKWMNEFTSAKLIYTANKNGVYVIIGNEYVFEVPQINPISTVGAGDTFNAAIAYYLVQNDIKLDDIDKMLESQIRNLVEIAVHFSQKVCMGYDNFIEEKLAKYYHIKRTPRD